MTFEHFRNIPNGGEITLSREKYKTLYICFRELQRLRAAGVDNWEGYDEDPDNEYEDEDEE